MSRMIVHDVRRPVLQFIYKQRQITISTISVAFSPGIGQVKMSKFEEVSRVISEADLVASGFSAVSYFGLRLKWHLDHSWNCPVYS